MTRPFRASHLLFAVLLSAVFAGLHPVPAIGAPAGKTGPCFKDLAACPARGCAQAGTSDAILNQQKRHRPTGETAVSLSLDDFESLQTQADKLFPPRPSLTSAQRKKLQHLAVANGEVSEGDLVQVMGFIVGRPHDNKSGESVNCRLKGRPNNDFHITIARDSNATEYEGIVVEMIPQGRPAAWSLTKLQKATDDGTQVLVRGQLLFDSKHVVNDDPDNDIGGQPKRFSLWEVHPITQFHQCTKGQDCDEKDLSQWQELEKVNE